MKVGISPFGIWRPGHPPGIAGFDAYAGLYADARRWLNQGWVDYFSPQLYWPIKQEKQSFPKLLAWWAGENTKKRHLWPGLIPSRVTGTDRGWPAGEIADQIKATRAQPGATGDVLFSMKPLLRNTGGIADALRAVYAEPALVPASPWLASRPPARPRLDLQEQSGRRVLRVRPAGEPVRLYVVRSRAGGKWSVRIQPADGDRPVAVPLADRPERVLVTAIDRTGTESEPATAEK